MKKTEIAPSVNLYYTQKVRGFQQQSVKYSANSVRISLKRTKFQCPRCGYEGVTVEPVCHRRVRGSPLGECREPILEFETHRLYCPRCQSRAMEHIPFLSQPMARITKALERTILELRSQMSLQVLAKFYHIAMAYQRMTDSYHAKLAFHRWYRLAEETKIPELATMAKTIRNKLDGIVSFWTFRHISNAKMEGFNNKIRWLIRQAYGFRDREYFKLKIYQLPEISCEKAV